MAQSPEDIAKEIAAYKLAVQQEFETGNPSIDDTAEDVNRKVRRLFLDCMPAVAMRVRALIDGASSESVQLRACQFAYEVVCIDKSNGPTDPLTELLTRLSSNDPAEAATAVDETLNPNSRKGK